MIGDMRAPALRSVVPHSEVHYPFGWISPVYEQSCLYRWHVFVMPIPLLTPDHSPNLYKFLFECIVPWRLAAVVHVHEYQLLSRISMLCEMSSRSLHLHWLGHVRKGQGSFFLYGSICNTAL